jgi:hypothetical protein
MELISKLMFKKSVWNVELSIWLRIERGVAGSCKGGDETSSFINNSKLSSAAEDVLASQERLCSIKFVSRTQRLWSN